MKYIRTKDGKIYDKGKIICYAFAEEYCSPNWNEDIEKYLQTKIVAEADTIEELCDAVLIKVNDNLGTFPYQSPVVRNDVHDYLEVVRAREQFGGTRSNNDFTRIVVACIWLFDSEGVPTLKNVARLNEKGELELL